MPIYLIIYLCTNVIVSNKDTYTMILCYINGQQCIVDDSELSKITNQIYEYLF